MSYISVYGFGANGEICSEVDIPNAWRGFMAVWRTMEERYLPQYVPAWARPLGLYPGASPKQILEKMSYLPSRCADFANPNAVQEVWNLVDDEHVPLDERICMCATFDKVLVKRESFKRVAQAFRTFDGVTCLPEQADVLESFAKDDNIIAAGFSSSLVTGWAGRGIEDKDGNCRGYNCLTQDDHFWLSDDIKF